jgi:hypothetical protein
MREEHPQRRLHVPRPQKHQPRGVGLLAGVAKWAAAIAIERDAIRVKAARGQDVAARVRLLSHAVQPIAPGEVGPGCATVDRHRAIALAVEVLLRRRAGAFGECRDQWRGEVERVGRRYAVDELPQACVVAVVRSTPRQAGGGDARQLVRLVVKVRLAAVVCEVAIVVPSVRLTVGACQAVCRIVDVICDECAGDRLCGNRAVAIRPRVACVIGVASHE